MALAEPPSRRRLTDGDLVAEFIESHCREIEGARRGELVELLPWELDLLDDLFELEPRTLTRKYVRALIGVAKKNGKSTLSAGIALYLLSSDGENGAQVYSCAGDKEQARIVFGTARNMVELDPGLSSSLRLYRDAIEYPANGSVYRVVSAEAYTKDGLNPSGVIFDELHVQPNRELWDVMTQGSGTRRQPLCIAITTAGYDRESICYELYEHGRKIERGEAVDPRFFFRWWEPSNPDCDIRDRQAWRDANPSLGEHLRESDLEDAVNRPGPEFVFRRYRLNMWTSTFNSWLPANAWLDCLNPVLELSPEYPIHVGIDLGNSIDPTAVVVAQRQGSGDDAPIVIRSRIWRNPFQAGTPECDEYTFNEAELRNYCRELRERFPLAAAVDEHGRAIPGPEYSYDPWGMSQCVNMLQSEGFHLHDMPQYDRYMIPASQDFYETIVNRRLAHDGDPILAEHIRNAIAAQRDRGWRLDRPKRPRLPNDGAIAAAMAVHRAMQPAPKPRKSAYEDHGLTSV